MQPARLLQVGGVLRVDYLKQDLLDVSLIGFILNDLTELDAVDFCGDKTLKLVEQAFLLRQNRLEHGRDLGGHEHIVDVCLAVGVRRARQSIELLQTMIVVAYLPV